MWNVDMAFPFLTSIIIAALPLLYFMVYSYLCPSSNAPCPQSYPIIGNLIGFLRNHHRFHDWVADMLSTTPSLTLEVKTVFGLSRGICTANPENLDHFLRTNFPNYVKGTRFNSALQEILGNGIFNADGELWSGQRKIASHEFNTRSLKQFIRETVQSQLSNSLMPYMAMACDNGEAINLQDVLQKFTFDNICNVAFGVDLNRTDEKDVYLSFARAFDYAVKVSSDRLLSPLPAIWKIKRFLNIGSEKRYKEAIEVVKDYAMNILKTKEEKIENDVGKGLEIKQDLLTRFLDSVSDYKFHDQEEKTNFLRDIVINFILAGMQFYFFH
ncbi:unnamed protein product [Cuscuta campestris]|uniref:Cytochrome P450 n=1 Tax=Cuscuta campestris TaxID=132261 RepID=A0A484L2F6_9ASTE|nr:unnamed protein product [Cuscuta campestris]